MKTTEIKTASTSEKLEALSTINGHIEFYEELCLVPFQSRNTIAFYKKCINRLTQRYNRVLETLEPLNYKQL